MPTEFYELVKRRIAAPKDNEIRICTAAVWSCALCGHPIDGMGGPGRGEICLACGKDILAGRLRVERPSP